MKIILYLVSSFFISIFLFLLMSYMIMIDSKKIDTEQIAPREIFLSDSKQIEIKEAKEVKKIKTIPKENLQIEIKVQPMVQKVDMKPIELAQVQTSVSIKPIQVQELQPLVSAPSQELSQAPTSTQEIKSNRVEKIANNTEFEHETIDAFLVLKRVEPKYPRRAKRMGVSGFVNCDFKINPKGEVFDIKIVKSSPKGMFDKAAVDALKRWKFGEFDKSKKYKLSTIKFNFKVE